MNVKKFLNGKTVGFLMAGVAAIGAFATERENQKKEAELKLLKETVENLNKKVNG